MVPHLCPSSSVLHARCYTVLLHGAVVLHYVLLLRNRTKGWDFKVAAKAAVPAYYSPLSGIDFFFFNLLCDSIEILFVSPPCATLRT